jgi:hypothetical protein
VTRIYENPGFATRMNVSCVVILIAALFGCFELWSAYSAGGSSGTNYLFALFFFGGAAYAAKQFRDGYSDSVVSLDLDRAKGEAAITLWRPFGAKKISGRLDQLTDWQFQVKAGKTRTPLLTAHHPDYPRPLELELRPGLPVSEGLRGLAPDAVAAFEQRRNS